MIQHDDDRPIMKTNNYFNIIVDILYVLNKVTNIRQFLEKRDLLNLYYSYIYVVDVRKGIRSLKNAAPILFINTPGKEAL